MTITRIRIEKLHGYINKDIYFDPKINILVGINGSSKTSILNIISWLLQPSIPHLCTIAFESIILDFVFEDKNCSIKCFQKGREFRYELCLPDKINLHPLIVNLAAPPLNLRTTAQQEDLRRTIYSGLAPDKKEMATWTLIQSLPSPIVVGLERTVGGEGTVFHISDAKAIALGIPPESDGNGDDPIRRVEQMARDAFSRYRASMINLNDKFRDQIMLSAFDYGLKRGSKNPSIQKLTIEQIEELETRISAFFAHEKQLRPKKKDKKNIDIGMVAHRYLVKLKKLVADLNTKKRQATIDSTHFMLQSQFARINKLLQYAEEFETNSKKEAQEIDRYLGVLNDFFNDSAKQILFDLETGSLQFKLLDKSGENISDSRPIEVLSSGERQILVLLTYLTFIPGKIFIIDEPELSLHPKWQEEFMEAVKKLMPDTTQLIIATHSPALVGRNMDFCKVLLPYNE